MKIPQAAFINLNPSNLSDHHLCCALSGQKHSQGVIFKKEFLNQGFHSGLVFRKLDVRGKVFVEFAPAETAWKPVEAPGCLVIHCLWVSGRYQGHGLGRDLWDFCRAQADNHEGIVAVSGKSPYLTSTDFYLHLGFEILDQSFSGFQLVGYPHQEWKHPPRFTTNAKKERVPENQGVHFEYTHQCPFVPDCLKAMFEVAAEFDLEVTSKHLVTVQEAQQSASPFGTFGAFLYGRLITHELMSPNKFRKLLESCL